MSRALTHGFFFPPSLGQRLGVACSLEAGFSGAGEAGLFVAWGLTDDLVDLSSRVFEPMGDGEKSSNRRVICGSLTLLLRIHTRSSLPWENKYMLAEAEKLTARRAKIEESMI